MKLHFTRSNKIGSRFICWVLGEPCSHVVVDLGVVMVHASMTSGFTVEPTAYLDTVTVVHTLGLGSDACSSKMRDLLNKFYHRPYDWRGAIYLGYRRLMKRWFGWPLPARNWGDHPYYLFCCEWAEIAADVKLDSMLSPEELWQRLLADSGSSESSLSTDKKSLD